MSPDEYQIQENQLVKITSFDACGIIVHKPIYPW